MKALVDLPRNTQGLVDAWRWVQQQRAAGAFKGEVIGPLGLEVKVRRGPHAERLAQNLEQVRLGAGCFWRCIALPANLQKSCVG